MYSLLFRSKWVAALWVGSLVGWIWFTTPRDDEAPPAAALVAAGSAQFIGGAMADDAGAREERRRRAALAEFNAGADDPSADGFGAQ